MCTFLNGGWKGPQLNLKNGVPNFYGLLSDQFPATSDTYTYYVGFVTHEAQ